MNLFILGFILLFYLYYLCKLFYYYLGSSFQFHIYISFFNTFKSLVGLVALRPSTIFLLAYFLTHIFSFAIHLLTITSPLFNTPSLPPFHLLFRNLNVYVTTKIERNLTSQTKIILVHQLSLT